MTDEHEKAGADRAVDLLSCNKQLKAENKKMKELKCPPIESGDSCICPIEELETIVIKKADRIEKLEAESKILKTWQIKPTEAICLTDMSCRYKKVFKPDEQTLKGGD